MKLRDMRWGNKSFFCEAIINLGFIHLSNRISRKFFLKLLKSDSNSLTSILNDLYRINFNNIIDI